MEKDPKMVLGPRPEDLIAEILHSDADTEKSAADLMSILNTLPSDEISKKSLELLSLNNFHIEALLARHTDFEKLPLLAAVLFEKSRFAIDSALANNPTLPEPINEKLIEKYSDPKYRATISGNPTANAEHRKKIGDIESQKILNKLRQ